MSAGRPLEPAGNGRPRWMAAAGATPSGYAPRTESGVQVDSSVAHQLRSRDQAMPRAVAISGEWLDDASIRVDGNSPDY